MSAWVLVLNMHVMNPKPSDYEKSQVIEIKGFSTEKDCEKADEAATHVFMLKKGELNGLISECKRSN